MRTTILLFVLHMVLNSSSVFAQPGTLDSSFSKDGKVFTSIGGYKDGANAVAIQKNGKILAAGYSQDSTGKSAFALVRYLTHGRVDSSFGNNGIVTTYFPRNKSSVANAVAIQNDGKIILAGYIKYKKSNVPDAIAISRYLPDGSLDYSFGLKGKIITDIGSNVDAANAIAIQPDGKIVVAGNTYNKDTSSQSIDIAVVRYKPNGTPDSSFGVNGKVVTDFGAPSQYYRHNADYGNAIAILPNGKIIVGGHSDVFDGNNAFALVRYKSNGSIDSSFGKNGMTLPFIGYGSQATSMMILPNGKILLAGYTLTIGPGGFTLAQCKKDGTLDSSFGNNGIVLASHYPSYGKSIAVQQNGKIIMAGVVVDKLELLRFTRRGALDSSFDTNDIGLVFGPTVKLQEDGKIVVAGNGQNKFAVVRYNGDPVGETPFSDNILSKQGLSNISSAYASPNPVKDILNIQNLSSSIKTISIFNLNGKVLQQAVTPNNSYSFDIKQLPGGIYFVSIKEGEKHTVLKFIKE